jgi:rare lipoprotein A
VFPLLIFVIVLLLTSCTHPKQSKVNLPPPPTIGNEPGTEIGQQPRATKPEAEERGEDKEAISLPTEAKPIYTETGIASWYGPPYHNRRGSNGEVYNMNALTAAHRTIPLGSICRVTNLKTGNSTVVRITDRGPFVKGRIVDLSLAAAKQVDVWKPGLAPVKVEVLKASSPLETGGRWAVEIGAFDNSEAAGKLADHLTRHYHSAHVVKFASPTGAWWVRVRVLDDDKQRAEELARATETSEGAVFLVRLD